MQHRLKERAKEVNELLQKKAFLYVCGDAANMAREVNAVLAQILAEQRGISEAKGEEIVKNMRAANQYQVCPPRAPLGQLLWHLVPIKDQPCFSMPNQTNAAISTGGRLVVMEAVKRRTCGYLGVYTVTFTCMEDGPHRIGPAKWSSLPPTTASRSTCQLLEHRGLTLTERGEGMRCPSLLAYDALFSKLT